jgi:outer membrane protein OmpA-like peptidoglycan-associated protein
MWRRWSCLLWAALGMLGLLALAWALIGRGDMKAQQVRERTQADAANILHAAGFPWARLEIDNEVGRVVGEAPSLPLRAAAFSAAGTLLMPMMGAPGVFARIEDGQSSLASMPAPTLSGAASATLAIGDCQAEMARLLAAEQIRFKVSSAELDPASGALIERLKGLAARCPQARIRVEGHTDAQGEAEANLRLSRRRAQAVVAALVKVGVPAGRLRAEGLGETRLLDPADTPGAHERNRRIEFHLAASAR